MRKTDGFGILSIGAFALLVAGCGDGEIYFPKEVGDRLKATMDGLPEAQKRLDIVESDVQRRQDAEIAAEQRMKNRAELIASIRFCDRIPTTRSLPGTLRKESEYAVAADYVTGAQIQDLIDFSLQNGEAIKEIKVSARCFLVEKSAPLNTYGASLSVIAEDIRILSDLSTSAPDLKNKLPKRSGNLSLYSLYLEVDPEATLNLQGGTRIWTKRPSRPGLSENEKNLLAMNLKRNLVETETLQPVARYLGATDANLFCEKLVGPHLNKPGYRPLKHVLAAWHGRISFKDPINTEQCKQAFKKRMETYNPLVSERSYNSSRKIQRNTNEWLQDFLNIKDFYGAALLYGRETSQPREGFSVNSQVPTLFAAMIQTTELREFIPERSKGIRTYSVERVRALTLSGGEPGDFFAQTYFPIDPEIKIQNETGKALNETTEDISLLPEFDAPEIQIPLITKQSHKLFAKIDGDLKIFSAESTHTSSTIVLKPELSARLPRVVSLDANQSMNIQGKREATRLSVSRALSATKGFHNGEVIWARFQEFIEKYEKLEGNPSGKASP